MAPNARPRAPAGCNVVGCKLKRVIKLNSTFPSDYELKNEWQPAMRSGCMCALSGMSFMFARCNSKRRKKIFDECELCLGIWRKLLSKFRFEFDATFHFAPKYYYCFHYLHSDSTF